MLEYSPDYTEDMKKYVSFLKRHKVTKGKVIWLFNLKDFLTNSILIGCWRRWERDMLECIWRW